MSIAPQPCSIVLNREEYDSYTSPFLHDELAHFTAGDGVVDCRNVKYLDSTALTALVQVLNRARAQDPDSTLTLINVRPQLRRVFELTGLDAIFAVK
jgi:anti-sigma B factor antagonist